MVFSKTVNGTIPDDETLSSDIDYVSVSNFYSGRSIFITGGTGFMGKVRITQILCSICFTNMI